MSNMSGGWLFMALIASTVGGSFLLYGYKQRDGLSLGFGLAMSTLPMVAGQAWLGMLILGLLCAAFYVARKAL